MRNTVATTELCESNGSTETITHNVTNVNCGDTDAPNLVPATYPITAGQNAYFKLHRLHVTGGTFNQIDNLQAFLDAALGANESMDASLNTNQANYDSVKVTVYAQPNKTTYTAYSMPTADPAAANLGIAGSLTGTITSAPAYSDYLKSQLHIAAGHDPGNITQRTKWLQYDEQ